MTFFSILIDFWSRNTIIDAIDRLPNIQENNNLWHQSARTQLEQQKQNIAGQSVWLLAQFRSSTAALRMSLGHGLHLVPCFSFSNVQ